MESNLNAVLKKDQIQKILKKKRKPSKNYKLNMNQFAKKIKEILDSKVEKVVLRERLDESICVLVTSEFCWTTNMELIMKAQALRDNSMASYMISKKLQKLTLNMESLKN